MAAISPRSCLAETHVEEVEHRPPNVTARSAAATTDIDVIGTPLRAHEDSSEPQSNDQRGISAAFPDLVRRSHFWLPPEENDHVEQDYSGPRVCVRRHLRRSGVCWS